jgi:hypothetical protein
MNEPQIICNAETFPRILDTPQHPELLYWLLANGIKSTDVTADSTITVETSPNGERLIRYTAYRRDAEGHCYLVDNDDSKAATEERVTPLAVEMPTTWRVNQEQRNL